MAEVKVEAGVEALGAVPTLTFPSHGRDSGGNYVYDVRLDGEPIGTITAWYAGALSRRVGWVYYLNAPRLGVPRHNNAEPRPSPEAAAQAVAAHVALYYWRTRRLP